MIKGVVLEIINSEQPITASWRYRLWTRMDATHRQLTGR